MKRQNHIRQRRRIFVGCEGESEQSYIALIQRHLGAAAAFHIVAPVLNGGDPLALLESARKAIRAQRANGRDPFVERFVLIDSDLRGRSPARDVECGAVAAEEGIDIVWQEPCHEAMLLRHLIGCHDRRPATSTASLEALRREWPRYRKNMTAQELEERIDRASLERAVEHDLEVAKLLRLVEMDR